MLTLDGEAGNFNLSTSTSLGASLRTTKSNDIIGVIITSQAPGTGTSPGVSDNFNGGGGLSWTHRINEYFDGSSTYINTWWAMATAPITSGSVTVTYNSSSSAGLISFGVNGANLSTPFDIAGPVLATFGGSQFNPVSIITSNPKEFVFGAFAVGNNTNTPAAPWNLLDSSVLSNTFFEGIYQIVSSTGTYTIDKTALGEPSTLHSGFIDAIQAPAAGDNLVGEMPLIQMKRKSLGWTPPLVDHRRRQWRRNRSFAYSFEQTLDA